MQAQASPCAGHGLRALSLRPRGLDEGGSHAIQDSVHEASHRCLLDGGCLVSGLQQLTKHLTHALVLCVALALVQRIDLPLVAPQAGEEGVDALVIQGFGLQAGGQAGQAMHRAGVRAAARGRLLPNLHASLAMPRGHRGALLLLAEAHGQRTVLRKLGQPLAHLAAAKAHGGHEAGSLALGRELRHDLRHQRLRRPGLEHLGVGDVLRQLRQHVGHRPEL
mmetsp:Transcript_1579/g.4354  ORF Transcript_1579/g.4354 Transcript_1579/m.4354 type:complete len:221 (+) Transcript_1579:682-1344(+)